MEGCSRQGGWSQMRKTRIRMECPLYAVRSPDSEHECSGYAQAAGGRASPTRTAARGPVYAVTPRAGQSRSEFSMSAVVDGR